MYYYRLVSIICQESIIILISGMENDQAHNIPTSKTTIFGSISYTIGKSFCDELLVINDIVIIIKIILISNIIL